MPIQETAKSGIVIKMCRDAGLQAPNEAVAVALFDEANRLAADMGLREAYHFLTISVELAREEPYDEVLRKMQALTLSEQTS